MSQHRKNTGVKIAQNKNKFDDFCAFQASITFRVGRILALVWIVTVLLVFSLVVRS